MIDFPSRLTRLHLEALRDEAFYNKNNELVNSLSQRLRALNNRMR